MKRAKKSVPAAPKTAKAKPKAGARPATAAKREDREDVKVTARASKSSKTSKSAAGPASGKRATTKVAKKADAKKAGAKASATKASGAKPSTKRAGSTAAGPSSTKRALPTAERTTKSSSPVARTNPKPALAVRIRELEAELDRRIDEASRRDVAALAPESRRDLSIDDHAEDDVDDADDIAVDTNAIDTNDIDGAPALPASDVESSAHDPAGSEPPPSWTPRPSGPLPSDVVLHGHLDPHGTTASPFGMPRPSGPLPAARPSRFDVAIDDEPRSVPSPAESVIDTARETARDLLSSNFYLRKWGRLAMRGRSEEVDDFGYDPTYDERLRPMLDFLYATYFRVETQGIDNVPKTGRAVLVANHSGTLPLDGLMIKTAIRREHAAARPVRWLTEDFIYHFPYVGSVMNRLGAVRACQENAERLLAKEQLLAVFPEGIKGIGKLFAERYRLQRFGRGGFVKLCLRTSTPIVPVAIVGAEETNPMLFRLERLSKLFGLPYVPVTPTFPLLGPVGLLPAPTKWQMIFGEPIDVSGYDASAADDDLLVARLAERVRASIQTTLDRAVTARKSVFFG